MNEFVRVSDIASLLFCQRYCYFNLHFPLESQVSEFQAMKEIYFSWRNYGEDWKSKAESRFLAIYGKENLDLFKKAIKNFKFSSELNNLKSIETEVEVRSDKLKLIGVLDEVVESFNEKLPLILGFKAPDNEIWYKDRIKLSAFCIMLKIDKGYIYYCRSGILKDYKVRIKDKRVVLKAIDRVRKLKNNFLPEKEKSNKCKNCKYNEICNSKTETFASKFL